MRQKTPKSWADRLQDAPSSARAADAAQARGDQAEVKRLTEPPLQMIGLETLLEQDELRTLRIRVKELEMGLHLAKAKICELELEKIKKTTDAWGKPFPGEVTLDGFDKCYLGSDQRNIGGVK
jgi:hypothetical protein